VEIILFNAGEYEQTTDKDDKATTALTKKAEKLTARAAQGLDRLLPKKVKVEVWSNLTPHLSQTAEIIAEELDVKRKIVNAIDHENVQDVVSILTEHAKDKCVIIVGEKPYLEQYARQLSGTQLELADYYAAGLQLNPPEQPEGQLLWFCRPVIISRLR
jgi:phosphohistidine phosphatase SixA